MVKAHRLHANLDEYSGRPLEPFFALQVILPSGKQRFGNGFVISPWQETIITASHVVEGAARVHAWSRMGGKPQRLDCIAVACDEDTDLAVLRLPKRIAVSLQLSASSARIHGPVTLRAYLNWKGWTHRGLKWDSVRATTTGKWIAYGAVYGAPGASGGAVFDQNGRVAGIHHGSFRMDGETKHLAAVCDLGILQQCREEIMPT